MPFALRSFACIDLKGVRVESEADRYAPVVILMSSESVSKHLSKPIFGWQPLHCLFPFAMRNDARDYLSLRRVAHAAISIIFAATMQLYGIFTARRLPMMYSVITFFRYRKQLSACHLSLKLHRDKNSVYISLNII